jgi:hypothetical protein
MAQFKEQVAEAVLPPDGMVTVELDDEGASVVQFKVPVRLDGTADDITDQIKACETAKDMSLLLLGAEQRERWVEAGYSDEDFAILLASESRGVQERMRDFRYRPSGR